VNDVSNAFALDRLATEVLTAELAALGSEDAYADPLNALDRGIRRYKPVAKIRTVDWAEENRKFRLPDSAALVPYDRWRTPHNIAPMDALDEEGVELVVMVKPSRSGGTAICENYLAKLIDIGPFPRTAWYLGSDAEIGKYVETVITPLFQDHPRLQAKVGTGRSDDTKTFKRIDGQPLEFLAAKDPNFRNKEFAYGVMDEPDGWSKFGESPGVQLQGRQKNIGRRRKGVILSHPDRGWSSGVAAEWVNTSRGVCVYRCTECASFAVVYAPKQWKDIPQFKLDYEKQAGGKTRQEMSADERIDLARRTAGLVCPHCGVSHNDAARDSMADESGENEWWLHRGQTLDPQRGILGEPDPIYYVARGFWHHGTMLKTSPLADLAAGLEEALTKYERSGGSRKATKRLREYHSKQLCEIFEGKSSIAGLTSEKLQKRAKEAQVQTTTLFPAEALFIVAAVDVQIDRFDVSFYAFDRMARSWWLDRVSIRQRKHADGVMRDIRTRENQDDWQVIIDEVLLRRFPIAGREDLLMPVACVTVDVGDGNVTAKGREFARQSIAAGHTWGGWPRIRLIRGSASAKAEELGQPRVIDRDDQGKKIEPPVPETTLGVHKLKELILDRLAIEDGGPGQCFFNANISSNHFDELFNEPLVDGKFERQGPNESFDLAGYAEAARLMLDPDRKDINWDDPEKRPIWARPVTTAPVDNAQAPASKPRSIFEQFDALNEE
jgi:phage terminase large subunit GpA-like protein